MHEISLAHEKEWKTAVFSLINLMDKNNLRQCIINAWGKEVSVNFRSKKQIEMDIDVLSDEMEKALIEDPQYEKLSNGKWRFNDPLDAGMIE